MSGPHPGLALRMRALAAEAEAGLPGPRPRLHRAEGPGAPRRRRRHPGARRPPSWRPTAPTWPPPAGPGPPTPSSTGCASTRSGSTPSPRAIREVAALPDPVGRVTASWSRPNGLSVKKVRIPLGVVLMVYEARPNVTAEAAALCVKSGNACILRPGSDALASSLALGAAFAEGLEAAGLPAEARPGGADGRPRGHLRAARPRRPHRPGHPARRPRAHPGRGRALPGAGGEALPGGLPPLPRRDAPARPTPWPSP